MRATWLIARKELLQGLRNRSFYIVGIAAPLVLAFIFNLVMGGAIGSRNGISFDFGLADSDTGPISDGFEQMLAAMEESGIIALTRFDFPEAAAAAVDDGDIDAAFVLPEDLSGSVVVGGKAGLSVLGNVNSSIGTAVAEAIARQFALGIHRAVLSARAAIAAGGASFPELASVSQQAAVAAPPVAVEAREVPSRQLAPAAFFVAGMGIFFTFFIAGLAATSVLEERQNGTLARLLAAPVRPASIVAGKTVASVAMGILAMVVLAVAATLIMGANWGNLALALLIFAAAVIAAAGIMTLVGGVARTAEQAQALQSIVALTLAMAGGSFVPITAGEGFVAQLRFVTPNAWYLQGLGDLVGGAYGSALTAVAILLAIGLVAGAAGLFLVGRSLRP